MIDFDKIQQTIVSVCDVLVGDDLSRINGNPAIIREYSSILRPKAPYLLFDITDLGSSNTTNSAQFFDSVTGEYKIQNIHDVSIRFTSYGDDAKKIISKLYSGFRRPSVKNRIVQEIPDMAITNMRGIKTIEVFNDTQFVTSCYFTVIFGYVNTEIDPFERYVDVLGLVLTVYDEEEQPELILTFNTTTPPSNNISGNP